MSVELVNNCVALPHWVNWRDGISWKRRWRTEVASGVTTAEDRSTGAPNQPLHTLGFTLNAFHPAERTRIEARLHAALKSGRLICPFFPRAQYIKAFPALPPTLSQSVANTYEVNGLEVGKLYFYEAGPYDVQMTNTVGLQLGRSGWFFALSDLALILVGTDVGVTGKIYRAQFYDYCDLDGLWPFATGQYAFFLRPRTPENPFTHENKSWLINIGGAATGSFLADAYTTGGTVISTASAINTSLAPQPAPAAVYQTARAIAGNDASATITCTLEGLHPSVPCRVRLHFAEIQSGYDGSTARRQMDIQLSGQTTSTWKNLEPYALAGNALNKAVVLELESPAPGPDGKLKVIVKPSAFEVLCAAPSDVNLAASVNSLDGVTLPPFATVLLRNQTNATEHGVYQRQATGLLARAVCGDTGAKLHALPVIKVQQGALLGGSLWRLTTPLPITLGTTNLEYDAPANAWHAILNGVEVRQYVWEVPALAAGSQAGRVKFAAPLNGVYDTGSAMFPAHLGRVVVDESKALTDWINELQITIEEPPAEVSASIASCPAEVCPNDGPFSLEPPFLIEPPALSCAGGMTDDGYTPFFANGSGFEKVLVTASHPNSLPAGVLSWWKAQTWAKWLAKKSADSLTTTSDRLVMYPAWNGSGWNAVAAYDGFYFNLGGTALWYMSVEYCRP